MFWKTGRKPWSLAIRLTAWYCVSLTVLLILAVWVIDRVVSNDQDPATIQTVDKGLARFHDKREAFLKIDKDDLDEDTELRVIDPSGRVVFVTRTLASEIPEEEFPPPGAHRNKSTTDGRRFSLFTRQHDGWTYQLALNRTDERRVINHIYRNFASVAIPAILMAALVGHLLARAGLRPLRVIAYQMRSVSAERLDRRVPTDLFPRELADVGGSFNQVMERLSVSVTRLDQFAADVAHELRTPVHNLRTAAELALRPDRREGEARHALGAIVEEADRLGYLIDRLLLMARLADPGKALDWRETDIHAELSQIIDFYEPAATEAGIRLTLDAPGELRHRLDQSLLRRAVSNLVANALNHTPNGGRVEILGRETSGELVITVRDTGTGIPPDDLPRLFDRYYRPVGSPGDGVGLGLAIVKRVIELHGGAVSVESAPGHGTVMTLRFPGGSTIPT